MKSSKCYRYSQYIISKFFLLLEYGGPLLPTKKNKDNKNKNK